MVTRFAKPPESSQITQGIAHFAGREDVNSLQIHRQRRILLASGNVKGALCLYGMDQFKRGTVIGKPGDRAANACSWSGTRS